MIHIPFTLLAYLFNALAVLSNKFLLKRAIQPLTYIFYISCFNLLLLLLIPFIKVPAREVFFLSSFATCLWTIGVYLMFLALKSGSVSRVIPLIGTFLPLNLLYFSKEPITNNQFLAVLILSLAILLLTVFDFKGKLLFQELILSATSATLFALSYLLLRDAFLLEQFLPVLVWSKFILIPFCLAYFINLIISQKISIKPKKVVFTPTGLIFIAGQAFGSLSEVLLVFSISLATPSLVNSLQGTQYAFLFILSLILAKKYPTIFEEKFNKLALISKILGLVLIGFGLYLLAS